MKLDYSRDQVFKNFRNFIVDSGQEGDTLSLIAPPKFKGTKSLVAKRVYLLRRAYKNNQPVTAISLIFLTEICWAAGYVPFNWEMFASLLASHSKVIELTNLGSAPLPRCSFIKSLKGASKYEILPRPNIILSSTAYCEGIGHMFDELKKRYNELGDISKSIEEISSSMEEIVSSISHTADNSEIVSEISAASMEQKSGADQINQSINELNEISQQNAVTSEEMAGQADQFMNLSHSLIETINYFNINKKNIDFNNNPLSKKGYPVSTKPNPTLVKFS